MQGERSMSIGLYHPGEILVRRWQNDYGALPGDWNPPVALTVFFFCGDGKQTRAIGLPLVR